MTTVFKIEVLVSEKMLQDVVDILNKYEIDQEEGDQPLTLEEVKNNSNLLTYLCSDAEPFVTKDLFEFWNGDGWCEFMKYRK